MHRLAPAVDHAYRRLAADREGVEATYQGEWSTDVPELDLVDEQLRAALARRRPQELERRTTLVGPQRDEWRLTIGDRDSRTHASQGEQRSLALALRLAAHHVLTEVVGTAPVLLLDDVFSELDADRSRLLVASLPAAGQTIVTTAGVIPEGITPSVHLDVHDGRITRA